MRIGPEPLFSSSPDTLLRLCKASCGVPERFESCTVVPVQPRVGPYPQITSVILHATPDTVAGQSVRFCQPQSLGSGCGQQEKHEKSKNSLHKCKGTETIRKNANFAPMRVSVSPALFVTICVVLANSCSGRRNSETFQQEEVFSNPIYPTGSSPWLVYHGGNYYYTQTMNDHVSIWKAGRIADIASAPEHIVYAPENIYHISAPQLHRIDGKWYLYFSSDDGSVRDVRHIYVMENPAENPTDGSFSMLGWVRTSNVKDIHPTTFSHRGVRYLLWAGTDSARPGGISRWGIYLARMKNPAELDSPSSVISEPQYEWECQWIDEDGTSMSSPALVNEAPAFLYSRDSTRLLVYYAASETYTSYYCEGLLEASADADPLNPASWYKHPEPVFSKCERIGVLGPGHLSFFRTTDQLYILYNGKSRFPDMHAVDNRSCRMQPVSWGEDGIPILGYPVREDSVMVAPHPVN